MSNTRSKFGSVNLKKSDLLNNRLLIGIDCGLSLTKVIILKKENSHQIINADCEYVILDFGLFETSDLEAAVLWVKEFAFIPINTRYTIHITGSITYDRREIVESILKVSTEYIDGTLALIAGLKIGLDGIGFQNLNAPDVEVERLVVTKSSFSNRVSEALRSKVGDQVTKYSLDEPLKYPCLVHVCGSMSKFVYFDKEGKGELLRCQFVGAETMLGIGKCLFDTNNYENIMQLASKGSRGNVDTQIKDILSDQKDSPYGKYPPETALFPFGKSMDFNTGLEDYRKEDVASSLVAFYCILVIQEYFHMCVTKGISKVYLTGNVFRSDAFQREIKSFLPLLPSVIDMKMLDFGYARALGAIFCTKEDTETFYVTNDK